jgi:heptose-I-phosphate ethanolaminephosphotransferase
MKLVYSWDGTLSMTVATFLMMLAMAARLDVMLVLFSAGIYLLKPKWFQHLLEYVCIVVSGLLFLTDLFTLYSYHQIFGDVFVYVVLASNFQESLGFLKTYVLQFMIAIIIFICFLVLIRLTKKVFIRYGYKCYTPIVVSFVISFIIMTITWVGAPVLIENSFTTIERSIILVRRVYFEEKRYKGSYESLKAHHINLTRNNSTIPTVIFILGESTTRNHMGLYGYFLPNTPLLQQRFDKGDLYVFRDTISPESNTLGVMKSLFTFYRTGEKGYFSDYADIFTVLQAAGYTTTWISNQGRSESNDGDMDQLYSNLCVNKKFTGIRSFSAQSPYDNAVFPLLDGTLAEKVDRKFVVVHLLGTHIHYEDRYPKEYNIFSEQDEVALPPSSGMKKIVAEYDNAICYGDYIVNEIIKKVENDNALVIFVSDHGDDVCDERENFCGHTINGNFRMLEIPMIIWMSESCKMKNPELTQRLLHSQNRPFMTDDMIHVILDMLQIETLDYDRTKSVINNDYDDSRKRVFDGMEYSHGPTQRY